jgi:predicted TIM-barrel fold metal-dependent hydrolase
MLDGIFIFDCVAHRIDLSDDNMVDRSDQEAVMEAILEGSKMYQAPEYRDLQWRRSFSVEDMYQMLFVDAPQDMAMAQVVPQWEWFKDWYAPVKQQYEFAQAYSDRVLFCGGVDPVHQGLEAALEHLDFQINELGARSIKFYNGHVPHGWRCDDEQLAYPMYERCRDLGVNVIQFHKGLPFGTGNVEEMHPADLQKVARDFPDMTIVLHHLAMPYVDEAINIGARFPNVYLALSANFQFFLTCPRQVIVWLGQCLQAVGSERMLWGSEAALSGGPLPYLKAFMECEMPADLRDGFGYPDITREDRENILGRNFARLMGVDIEEKKRELGLVTDAQPA